MPCNSGPRKRIFYLLNKALHFEFFSKLSQSKVKWSFFAPVKKGELVLDSTQSQSGYTPLVEVNQAIFAWSFRPIDWLISLSIVPCSGLGCSLRKTLPNSQSHLSNYIYVLHICEAAISVIFKSGLFICHRPQNWIRQARLG